MLKQIFNEMNEICISDDSTMSCGVCRLGKSHRLPFLHVHERSRQAFKIMYMDVWRSSPIIVDNGVRFFILFMDDYIRYQYIFVLPNKIQVVQIFLKFEALVERKFNKKILINKSNGRT